MKIKLKDGAVPYSVNTARRVSVPLLPKVKEELQRMVNCGVIEEITEPTEWCAPMVPMPRKDGRVRICVGLNRLNKAVQREKYILPTLDDILPKLAGSSMFSLLDAATGFWQIPLDKDSAKLTTFITPFGRYFFHLNHPSDQNVERHFQDDLQCVRLPTQRGVRQADYISATD